MQNNANLLSNINKIIKVFGFQDYNLLQAAKELPALLTKYQSDAHELTSLRPKNIKNKLHILLRHLTRGLNQLTKANNIINDEELPLYSFIANTRNSDIVNMALDLPEFISSLKHRINEISDIGGRPRNSSQQFIIFHLVMMYVAGTKKPIKCGWDEIQRKGVGETFKFITSMRSILPKINSSLQLSKDNQFICKTILKLSAKYKDFSVFPSHLSNTET